MKMTSAEANKLLRELKTQKELVLSKEESVRSFVAATIENVEDVRPAYDYEAVNRKVEELDRKIRKVKHAINVFNTVTVIPEFEMTIDEMLVWLPQHIDRMQTIGNMAEKPAKTRVSGSGRSNIIEYEYANYDTEKAEADLTEMIRVHQRAQVALDRLNSTVSMEIDI